MKYGAAANQITRPHSANPAKGRQPLKRSPVHEPARVHDRHRRPGQTIVERGGVSEAIKIAGRPDGAQKKCCDDILRRLDKLDEIADMLQKMIGDQTRCKKELAIFGRPTTLSISLREGQPSR